MDVAQSTTSADPHDVDGHLPRHARRLETEDRNRMESLKGSNAFEMRATQRMAAPAPPSTSARSDSRGEMTSSCPADLLRFHGRQIRPAARAMFQPVRPIAMLPPISHPCAAVAEQRVLHGWSLWWQTNIHCDGVDRTCALAIVAELTPAAHGNTGKRNRSVEYIGDRRKTWARRESLVRAVRGERPEPQFSADCCAMRNERD